MFTQLHWEKSSWNHLKWFSENENIIAITLTVQIWDPNVTWAHSQVHLKFGENFVILEIWAFDFLTCPLPPAGGGGGSILFHKKHVSFVSCPNMSSYFCLVTKLDSFEIWKFFVILEIWFFRNFWNFFTWPPRGGGGWFFSRKWKYRVSFVSCPNMSS